MEREATRSGEKGARQAGTEEEGDGCGEGNGRSEEGTDLKRQGERGKGSWSQRREERERGAGCS